VLYPQILGPDFQKLPRALREFHSSPSGGSATGTVTVRHSNRWLARLVGFPRAGEQIPLRLNVAASGDGEVWTRHFDGVPLRSKQYRDGDLLMEEVGPLRIFFRLLADASGMRFESLRARVWRIPVPLSIQAEARGDDTSWQIQVTVAHVGTYRGMMVPVL